MISYSGAKEIQSLEQSLANRIKQVRELEATIEELNSTIAELRREVAALNEELAIERGLDKLEKSDENDLRVSLDALDAMWMERNDRYVGHNCRYDDGICLTCHKE